jgi:hypothetical protein
VDKCTGVSCRRQRSFGLVRLVAAGLAAALVGGSCGAHWDEEQRAEVRARYAVDSGVSRGTDIGPAPASNRNSATEGDPSATTILAAEESPSPAGNQDTTIGGDSAGPDTLEGRKPRTGRGG